MKKKTRRKGRKKNRSLSKSRGSRRTNAGQTDPGQMARLMARQKRKTTPPKPEPVIQPPLEDLREPTPGVEVIYEPDETETCASVGLLEWSAVVIAVVGYSLLAYFIFVHRSN